MRFRKIPRSWLIHSVQLVNKTTELGAFGSSSTADRQIVDHVRIVNPKASLSVTAKNEQKCVNAILIHQPDISTPHTFVTGEHLRFEGLLYEVVEVSPIYELTKLHHTEVNLSYVYSD